MNQTRDSSESDHIVDISKPLSKVKVSQTKKAIQNRPPKVNGKTVKQASTVVLNEEKFGNKRGSLKLKENLDTSNKTKSR